MNICWVLAEWPSIFLTKLWDMLIMTFRINCETKMKYWSIWDHGAYQRTWLSMLLRLFNRGKNILDRMFGKTWEVWHRHSWFCRHSNAFAILGHQEIHYQYDSNAIKTKNEAEQILWKVGKQVIWSVQRECSWLVQCQQIHKQRWMHQYQRLGIISLSGIHKAFPLNIPSFWQHTEWRPIEMQPL